MIRRSLLLMLMLIVACRKERTPALGGDLALPQRTAVAEAPAPSPPPPPSAKAATQMIVRTANVSLIVKDSEQALRAISAVVEARGGYLAETKEWREQEQVRATAVVRVPASSLSAVLAEIHKQAIRIERESISGEDVSAEYTDLNAQLVNAEATERELRELLGTVRQRTQKARDILEVYSELTKVRGEIERMRGRLKYLSQMVALSTINLELVPDVLAKPVVEPGWRPFAVFRDAARKLVATLKWFVEAAIWIAVYFLPIGLIFVLGALGIRQIWRYGRRRTR